MLAHRAMLRLPVSSPAWLLEAEFQLGRSPLRCYATASSIHRGLRRSRGAPEPSYGGRGRPRSREREETVHQTRQGPSASRPEFASRDRGDRSDRPGRSESFAASRGYGRGAARDDGARRTERRPDLAGRGRGAATGPGRSDAFAVSRGFDRGAGRDNATRRTGRRPEFAGRGIGVASDQTRRSRSFAASGRFDRGAARDDEMKSMGRRPDDRNSSETRYDKNIWKASDSFPRWDGSDERPKFTKDRRTTPSWKTEDAKGSKPRPFNDEKTFTANDGTDGFSSRRRDKYPATVPYTTPASQFLYGSSVVEAALKADRRRLYNLYVQDNSSSRRKILNLARAIGLKVTIGEGQGLVSLLDKMSAGRPHNGFVLEASPLKHPAIRRLSAVDGRQSDFAFEAGRQSQEDLEINGTDTRIANRMSNVRLPFVLLLDGVQDTGNLGGIIRTAHFLGVDAVVTSETCAPLIATVLKASAGAAESLPLLKVSDTNGFVQGSKDNGWTVYASVAPPKQTGKKKQAQPLSTISLRSPLHRSPCVLMVGGEGDGLMKDLVKLGTKITIPGLAAGSTVDSLNVSVATGLLVNAFLRLEERAGDESKVTAKDAEEVEDIGGGLF